MARAQKQTARTDIYVRGLRTKANNKQGYTLDRSKPADAQDKILINKGEEYWKWSFKNGGVHFSKTQPKASQLTQSEYLSTIYSINEEIDDFSAETVDELRDFIDDIKSRVEEIRDQQEEKKSNMPDSLQEGPTGELLQERYDNCDDVVNQLDDIDLDNYEEPDEDDLRTDAIEELGYEGDEDDFTDDQEKEISDYIEQKKKDSEQEFVDEKLDELKGISFG